MIVRRLLIPLLLFVSLPLFGQNAFVVGTVRSEEGFVIADMTVAAYDSAGFLGASTLSDSIGRYTMTLAPGTYRLLAYDRNGNFATSFHENASSFEASRAVHFIANQTQTINFTLPRGRQIVGRVSDAAGAPMQGAVVAAYNLDGTRRAFTSTGGTGTYTLVVPAGNYKLVAYHEAVPYIAEFYRDQELFSAAQSVVAPSSGIDFSLALGVKVKGTVIDSITTLPIEGLNLVAYDLQGNVRFRTTTSPAGEFSIAIPTGSYKFAVDDPNQIHQTNFYRNVSSFASAAVISVASSSVPPDLEFRMSRKPDPTPKSTSWIAAAANAGGAGTTLFQTDLWIYNPSADPITVRVAFLRGGQDNSTVEGIPVAVAARQQRCLRNVLVTLFGTDGVGALRLDSESNFRVTSRTYNVPPNSATAGTFGLAIPGQQIGDSLSRATLTGLSKGAESRTNIGMLNPQPFTIQVKLEVFSAEGALLVEERHTLRPQEWLQRNNIVPPAENAYAVLSSSEGSFFSYASVVDEKSGDGTIILPTGD